MRSLPLVILGALAMAQETPAFLDMARPIPERVEDYLRRLTLEQKAALLDHRGPPVVVAGFTLRADQWNQCLNGVMWQNQDTRKFGPRAFMPGEGTERERATATTLFPTCIAMGATWDPDLVRTVAGVLSDEARAIYNGWHVDPKAWGEQKGLIYRAPVIDVGRNPSWGRTHEIYGEDAFHTGRMAVAYVQGLQGNDPRYLKVAATLKHFAVNHVEENRKTLNAQVSERWLQEYYLAPFREAVQEGGAMSLMASYNAINGVHNNVNHWLLTEVLKDAWGHQGFVVSDLNGIRSLVEAKKHEGMTPARAVAESIIAGCDFSDKEYREQIPTAVREGKLPVARLDDAVRRVMTVRMRLGEFDPWDRQPWSGLRPSIINSPAHRAVARKTAEASIVLLRNEGGFLPLDARTVKTVAVIGPHARRITVNNYNGVAVDAVTALAGIQERLGAGVAVRYAQGAIISAKRNLWIKEAAPQGPVDEAAERAAAVEAARGADVALLFVGTDSSIEHEALDRTSLGLPEHQQALVEAVVAVNPRTVVVQMSAGPLVTPWISEHVPAVLQAWWPGQEGGRAIAGVLFGDVNPAGRLPFTVYAGPDQIPPIDQYDLSKGFTYQYLRGTPLYAFGHGLSYTTFAYENLTLSATTAKADGKFNAVVTLANTGQRDGDEVVQLYGQEPAGQVPKPALRLVGFARVHLKAGTRQTVTIPVDVARLRCWDEARHTFVADPGTYRLRVGGSSDRLGPEATFTVEP